MSEGRVTHCEAFVLIVGGLAILLAGTLVVCGIVAGIAAFL